uniref:Uncharacterized protein n=1 Tax=Ciona intestinalis TaxID=7719 RepID=H2XRT2_CIOIN
MRKVGLWDCGFTEVGATELGQALQKLSVPLESINIGANKIGNGATALAHGLCGVRSLNLSQSNIPEHKIKFIKEKYQALPSPKPKIEGIGSMPSSNTRCVMQ